MPGNWFKKRTDDELPKELEGKTPEQVVAELAAAAELKKKVETLEAERTAERTQVATLSSQFEQVKQKLASTEANLNRLQNPPRTEEVADWNLDPENAFRQNVQPLVNAVVANSAMSARLLAIQSLDSEDTVSPADRKTMNGRLFRAWESEINEEAKKYPPNSMGTPGAWLGIYYLVKGRHADELADADTRKKKYNFVESATQGGPPPPPEKKDGVEALTDQEKAVAEKIIRKRHVFDKESKQMVEVDVTPAEAHRLYAARKAKMQFISG